MKNNLFKEMKLFFIYFYKLRYKNNLNAIIFFNFGQNIIYNYKFA